MAFSEGRALVIGVGSYPHIIGADIPASVEDAQEVRAVLQDKHHCGYLPERVMLLCHETARLEGIRGGFQALSQASETDTVLVYYSGHGAKGPDGTFYLTAHDTHAYGGEVVPTSAISEGELLNNFWIV